MTQARQPTRTRLPRTLRVRPFRSWTLRSRVLLVVVAMLTILAAIIGSVSVLALRSYLMQRFDQQLTSALYRGAYVVNRLDQAGSTVATAADAVVQAPGQPTGTLGAVRSSVGPLLSPPVVLARPSQSEQGLPLAPTEVPINTLPLLTVASDGLPRTVDLGSALGEYRVAAVTLDDGDIIIIGLPLNDVTATIRQLAWVVILVTLAVILLAVIIGSAVVRLAMRPLERVAGTAEQVVATQLDRGDVALSIRVPDQDTDSRTEVGKVGSALNRMLGHVAAALSARQASEQKVRQFVADASHELRTPLASIRGYAELTRRAPHTLPTDVTRSLDRIESEAKRMTTLVEDLLLLARLDEGRELDHDPVDLSSLLVDALSDAHAAGPDHAWNLELPDEPVEVIGDAARLHQVVVNLLANARVHTPEGTRVTAALAVEAEAGDAIIRIADDGPGISESVRETLFERFARGDSSRNRATGSTGLGLAIVHAVVEAHSGTVDVQSEPGETIFTVRLPFRDSADSERGETVDMPVMGPEGDNQV